MRYSWYFTIGIPLSLWIRERKKKKTKIVLDGLPYTLLHLISVQSDSDAMVADEGYFGIALFLSISCSKQCRAYEFECSVKQSSRWWRTLEFLRQSWRQPLKHQEVVKQEAITGIGFWSWKRNTSVSCLWAYFALGIFSMLDVMFALMIYWVSKSEKQDFWS